MGVDESGDKGKGGVASGIYIVHVIGSEVLFRFEEEGFRSDGLTVIELFCNWVRSRRQIHGRPDVRLGMVNAIGAEGIQRTKQNRQTAIVCPGLEDVTPRNSTVKKAFHTAAQRCTFRRMQKDGFHGWTR